MSYRSADLLIEDLWEAIEKVERYTAGFHRNGFIKDDKTIDSVVRNFEILKEQEAITVRKRIMSQKAGACVRQGCGLIVII